MAQADWKLSQLTKVAPGTTFRLLHSPATDLTPCSQQTVDFKNIPVDYLSVSFLVPNSALNSTYNPSLHDIEACCGDWSRLCCARWQQTKVAYISFMGCLPVYRQLCDLDMVPV